MPLPHDGVPSGSIIATENTPGAMRELHGHRICGFCGRWKVATVGEIANVLRTVFGEYRETVTV